MKDIHPAPAYPRKLPRGAPARQLENLPASPLHSPLGLCIVASAEQIKLAEVQAVTGSLAVLATADAGSSRSHHRPSDPGLVSSLQKHKAIGPRCLQQLVELRLGEPDLTQQFLQGHAAPVSAQDLGDETEYLGIGHGALWLPLLRPLRGTRLHGESKLTLGPRGGRGRCRSQSRAVSLSNSGGGVTRPDFTDQVLGSDLKSVALESEWEASDVTRGRSPRRRTLGCRLDVRSPELGTARLFPGREEVKTFVRLRWSFEQPEASDASRGAHWRRPRIRPTQPRKELTW